MRVYANDLVVYIACPLEEAEHLLHEIVHGLNTFGLHTTLRLKTSKSKVLLKGWILQQIVESLGVNLAHSIRYLRVMIGHVAEKDIYPLALSGSLGK